MERIASFTVDHTKMEQGLYVSRRDKKDNTVITTFDMRVTAPNKEPVMDTPAVHTIEHLCATFLRNSSIKEDVVYFGPMGCRTGFYIVLFGDLSSQDVYETVIDMCNFVLNFEGDIPGATAEECGNFKEQNLDMAKYYIKKYKENLEKNKNFIYK